MTSPVIHATRHHTLDERVTIVTNHHVVHLPVTEGDDPVGMVSFGDLVKWIITQQEETNRPLEH